MTAPSSSPFSSSPSPLPPSGGNAFRPPTHLSLPLPGEVVVKITQLGPSQVYLHMQLAGIGKLVLTETVTPVAPLQQRILHTISAPAWVPSILCRIVLWITILQFEKDIPMWCNKKYRAKPLLCRADAAVAQYRRWVTQFWDPTESVSFAEAAAEHARDGLGLPVGIGFPAGAVAAGPEGCSAAGMAGDW